jgi:hypothetical protein
MIRYLELTKIKRPMICLIRKKWTLNVLKIRGTRLRTDLCLILRSKFKNIWERILVTWRRKLKI